MTAVSSAMCVPLQSNCSSKHSTSNLHVGLEAGRKLTNRKIQAQRLMEPQMPLRASRVVKWWLEAASMAAVNTACMLCVCLGARTTRTVENTPLES